MKSAKPLGKLRRRIPNGAPTAFSAEQKAIAPLFYLAYLQSVPRRDLNRRRLTLE